MALDERYIVDFTLSEVFTDKTTGLPLANGKVYFYEDNNRNVLKPVYELSGNQPNYTYSLLPNPITLSAGGKIQDGSNNDVALYFYPYDQFGNVQNYYIAVYDANNTPPSGTPQFTREAWPNVVGSNDPTEENSSYINMLSNPQFHDVNFDTVNGLTVSYTGIGETTVEIGPNWVLAISHTGAGTCTIGRTSIAGTAFLPTNPSYTLDITPGANCSGLELKQRLSNNPAIWSPVSSSGGYIASSITFNTGKTVSIKYRPSTPGASADQQILSKSNTSGSFAQFTQTTLITPPANTAQSSSGYVDVVVVLETTGQTRLTSLQIVGLQNNQQNIVYRQDPVNRLKDFTFNYYRDLLIAKPIRSELTAWDFALNPSQWGATYAAAAIGANKSDYVWDQTVIYQSVNSGFSAARTTTGSLEITIQQNGTQVALVQYITQDQARELLTGKMSVNVAANKSAGAARQGLVSLWWTTGASLPDIKTPNFNSIVLTIDANGKPSTFNGTWNEVQRGKLGDARFTLSSSSTSAFNEAMLTGWDPNTSTVTTGATTATFFAIVVGFQAMDSTEKIDIQSISLNRGSLATKPAPQSKAEVANDCSQYYYKTFEMDVIPADSIAIGGGERGFVTSVSGAGVNSSNSFDFPVEMVANPTITFFTPVTTGAQGYNVVTANAGAVTTATIISTKNILVDVTGQVGWGVAQRVVCHFVADARLGR